MTNYFSVPVSFNFFSPNNISNSFTLFTPFTIDSSPSTLTSLTASRNIHNILNSHSEFDHPYGISFGKIFFIPYKIFSEYSYEKKLYPMYVFQKIISKTLFIPVQFCIIAYYLCKNTFCWKLWSGSYSRIMDSFGQYLGHVLPIYIG